MGRTFVGLIGRIAMAFLFVCELSLAAEPPGELNIRARIKAPGLYLTLPKSAEAPEQHNFTTTTTALANLDPSEIEQFVAEHPEIKDYRMVIIGPAVRGDEAETFRTSAVQALERAGLPGEVEIIRHPKTLRERIFNLQPRREDYERPIKSELKVAAWKILVAESLSFAVLLIPPILKGSESISPELNAFLASIALPLKVAIPMVVLDIAHMIPLVTFRRAMSNHNIRLTPRERFGRQFILSMFFSFNFYTMSRWPDLADFFGNLGEASPRGLLGGAASMLSVIVPASAFNMLSRTTVGTSLNIWEQRKPNRRFMVALLEAVTGIVIAPIYILSTMKALPTLVETPIMNLNLAHLGMLAIGLAGGVVWARLEPIKFKGWVRRTVVGCANAIACVLRKPSAG